MKKRLHFIISFAAILSMLALSQLATAQPTFTKSFSPSTIGPGSTSTLTFIIDNAGGGPVDMAIFTDMLPTGVTIADVPNMTISCAGGTVDAPAGGSTITLTDGQIGAGNTCTITVDVTADAAEGNDVTYMNTSGDFNSSAGNSGAASADLTVAVNRPGFSKSFSPSTINIGERSTLTFTIDNSLNASALSSLSFTDNLPAGMVIANPANASFTCGGPNPTLTAEPGSGLISFSSVGIAVPGFEVLPAGESCTVSVGVTGNATGVLGNISGELTSSSTGSSSISSGKASASLTVNTAKLLLEKAFLQDPVAPGDMVNLQFTITNLDRANTATDITFTDNLDAALSGLMATGLSQTVCNGGQISGTGLLTFTEGTLGAGESCTFTVPLQIPAGAAPGIYPNTTSTVSGMINGVPETGNTASDNLYLQPVPIFTKEFIGDPVGAGGQVTLRFTIENTSTDFSATNINFIDDFAEIDLPIGCCDAITSTPTDPCGAGSTLTYQADNTPPPSNPTNRLTFSGGNLAPAGMLEDGCTFDVTITLPEDAPTGTFSNTTTDINATINGTVYTRNGASDDLTIVGGVDLTKEFTDDPVLQGGTTNLEFTITNNNIDDAATNIAFTDDLDATLTGLTFSSATSNDCDGTISGDGTGVLTYSGGSLAADASCTFTVPVEIPMAAESGTYTNTTSTVTADVGAVSTTGSVATDELQVGGLLFSKAFIDDPVIAGEDVTLRFTIENAGTEDATNASFIYDARTVLPGSSAELTTVSLPVSPCGGSVTELVSGVYSFSGMTISGEQTCTFDLVLNVLAGATDGDYQSNTGNLTATINSSTFTQDPATDVLTIDGALLQLTKEFLDDPVAPGDNLTLEFTLTNLDPTRAASSIAFTDDLGAAIAGLTFDSVLGDDCGANITGTGTNMITFSNGSLAAGGSCTFTVSLSVPSTAPTSSIYTNTTSEVTGLIGGFAVTGAAATADFELVPLQDFSKSFDGPTTATGTAILTFTITNPNVDNVTDLQFQDNLNAVLPGLIATSLPTAPCGAGSSITGTSLLSFSGGNLAGSGGTCSFDVEVLVPASATSGSYVNTTTILTSDGLLLSDPATANLIIEPAPTFAKAFSPDVILLDGVSTLTFTIDNSASALAATDLDFTDNLPAGMVVATPPGQSSTCAGGTLIYSPGTGTFAYTGGAVAAGATCTVQVDVIGTATGIIANTTGDLTSSAGNSGTATDNLTVTEKPNAGDLVTNPTITDFIIECPGNDLEDGSNTSVAFELDYSAMDEIDPGTTYFEYAVLLADSDGTIETSITGTSADFDFAALSADTFTVYGLAYQTSTNSPNTVAAYLGTVTTIQEIIDDDNDTSSGGAGSGTFDLDINSEDTNGDIVQVIITPNPTLTAVTVADICQDSIATALLSGLTPSSTFTVTYDVSGDNTVASTTASVMSDANGDGSFMIDGTNFGIAGVDGTTITITMIVNDETTCSMVFSTSDIFTVFELPAANPPTILTCSADASSFDLTAYNDEVNATATVTWYDGQPTQGGTIIGSPATVDLNTVATSLWALVTDGNGCESEVQASVTIFDLPAAGMPLFVNDTALPGGDGLTWGTAFRALQTALALTCNCSIQPEIWVAAGTYTPSEAQDFDGVDGIEAREATFYINKDLQIYGGFAGTEDPMTFNLDDRNFVAYETILSGDIGIEDDEDDNAYHVLYLDGVSDAFILDGFTITKGLADGNNYPHFVGGGIFNDGFTNAPSNPTLANLVVMTNVAAAAGGGLYNDGFSGGEASPTISNSIFQFNQAFGTGGAVYNDGINNGLSSPVFTDCLFKSNFSSSVAGAVYNDGLAGESSPTFTNCTFEDNESSDAGGAVYNDGADGGLSNPIFTNAVFDNNMTGFAGGAMYNDGVLGTSSPTVDSSLFVNNSVVFGDGGAVYNNGFDGGESIGTFTACVFENNEATNNGGAVYNDGALLGLASPLFFNTSFIGNRASDGGALHNNGTDGGESSPGFTNCEFIENEATIFESNNNLGGAMYNDGDNAGNASPIITNCSFFGNIAIDDGDAIFNDADDGGGVSTPLINNTILWGNGDEVFNNGGTPIFSFSIIQGSGGSGGSWDTNLGTDNGNNLDVDPLYIDPTDGDLRVGQGSPAVNSGDNNADYLIDPSGTTAFIFTFPTDLSGNERVLEATIDRGAYEATCVMILTPPQDMTVCDGDDVSFQVVAMENVGTSLSYQWQIFMNSAWSNLSGQTGTSLALLNVDATDNGTMYRVVVTEEPTGCTVESAAVTLTVDIPTPTISVVENSGEKENDGIVCPGENVTLVASGGDTYLWNTGAVTSQITVNVSDTTTYTVTVTDAMGCTGVATQIISTTPTVTAFAGNNQLDVCGTEVMLDAVLPTGATGGWRIISGGGGSFASSSANPDFESENPIDIFTGQIGRSYVLEWVVSANGCSESTDRVSISFNPDADNDGVQNCNDICPGGDDTIDTDNDKSPDACDCDPDDPSDGEIVVINNNTGNTGVLSDEYRGSYSVTSQAKILADSTVTFTAGVEVVLKPGFRAFAGSNFTAMIEPDCTPTIPVAEAGDPQINICGTIVTLSANTPMPGTGTWTIQSGGAGTFSDVNDPNATFTGSVGGIYNLRWTITNAIETTFDQVGVSFNPDSDGDTVQDCNDICPGGDDTVDTDAGGAGMPDDCDCDPNDLSDEFITVNNNNVGNTAIIGDSIYQGSYSITSSGTVANDSVVTFVAGFEINLEPGFRALAGSDFHAYIVPNCNNILPLVEAPTTDLFDAQTNKIPTQQLSLQLEPNPTNNVTRIRFQLPQDGNINLRVLSTTGQLLLTAYDNARFSAGEHTQLFDARQLPAGLYYIQLETASERITRRLAVVK